MAADSAFEIALGLLPCQTLKWGGFAMPSKRKPSDSVQSASGCAYEAHLSWDQFSMLSVRPQALLSLEIAVPKKGPLPAIPALTRQLQVPGPQEPVTGLQCGSIVLTLLGNCVGSVVILDTRQVRSLVFSCRV